MFLQSSRLFMDLFHITSLTSCFFTACINTLTSALSTRIQTLCNLPFIPIGNVRFIVLHDLACAAAIISRLDDCNDSKEKNTRGILSEVNIQPFTPQSAGKNGKWNFTCATGKYVTMWCHCGWHSSVRNHSQSNHETNNSDVIHPRHAAYRWSVGLSEANRGRGGKSSSRHAADNHRQATSTGAVPLFFQGFAQSTARQVGLISCTVHGETPVVFSLSHG